MGKISHNGEITKKDGKYIARCQIQDGVERGTFERLDDAVKWVISTERAFNGNDDVEEVRYHDGPTLGEAPTATKNGIISYPTRQEIDQRIQNLEKELAELKQGMVFKGYKRTTEMTEELVCSVQDLLQTFPQQRFGQLLSNIFGDKTDLFNIQDEDFLWKIDDWGK